MLNLKKALIFQSALFKFSELYFLALKSLLQLMVDLEFDILQSIALTEAGIIFCVYSIYNRTHNPKRRTCGGKSFYSIEIMLEN